MDTSLKQSFVDSLLGVWEGMSNCLDPEKNDTILRYPKDIQARLKAGEDTTAICAELMTIRVQELEHNYPTKQEELMAATNDVRVIMANAKEDILIQKDGWRADTEEKASKLPASSPYVMERYRELKEKHRGF